MTNEKILTKALNKAFNNNYKHKYLRKDNFEVLFGETMEDDTAAVIYYGDNSPQDSFEAEYIIFSHKFAKAFWGEEMVHKVTDSGSSRVYFNTPVGHAMMYEPIWKYHLTQMVLEENPLKYLERFL